MKRVVLILQDISGKTASRAKIEGMEKPLASGPVELFYTH